LVGLNLVHRGDFNVTHFPRERTGDSRLCSPMLEFSNFIFK